jgi:hypothetical protein
MLSLHTHTSAESQRWAPEAEYPLLAIVEVLINIITIIIIIPQDIMESVLLNFILTNMVYVHSD